MEQTTNSGYNLELLEKTVRRVIKVETYSLGSVTTPDQQLHKARIVQKSGYIAKYTGRIILEDTEMAYDQLAGWLKPMGVIPLFRQEEGQHVILLVQDVPTPKPANPWVNLVLFVLTLASVLFTGASYGLQTPINGDIWTILGEFLRRGWPFAVSLILILGAHELGHYFAGRYHGVHVTLPYFIPFPFSSFGTMGAFINMKEPAKNKRVLLDIGIAGPLAGFILSVPILWIGLKFSSIDVLPLTHAPDMMYQMEGNSLLYLLMKYLAFGQLLPAPASYGQLPAWLHWLSYFFTSRPLPLGGTDVMLDAVAWAGWAGLLVTGLNLIPAGQLDGGHILYTLFGRKMMKIIFPVILVVLGVLGIGWNGWWLWVALIYFFGRQNAEPLDDITPLDAKRKVLALITFGIFFLTFVPVPLSIF
jgi:membrane-associated protease RseP (regulator of RpoE activity)